MTDRKSIGRGYGFGTAPVFLAAISTILGAILFLRFGYAVAHAGLIGAIMIILIGHAITIPTAMAVAEIATNLRVRGGGEYFIISRSFGSLVGGTIGISLYFSQAISVAFYMIAFSEAFTPLFGWFQSLTNITPDKRMISIPFTVVLLLIILKKGANIGVAALWIVVSILGISLTLFFLGKPPFGAVSLDLFGKLDDPDSFFKVFAIVFPAFTGMTAGVGLSGDLKNPRRSIPLGTLSATLTGMVVYLFVVFKLAFSVSPQDLSTDQLIMSKIALWGPIIPVGLAAATLSSAIGSILVAPRTMQALAKDRIYPALFMNRFLGSGKGRENEPVNATLVTSLIVIIFVALGSVDFVAQIISMFFMITYGSLCLVSFLQHFAGDPSYRPTFRSRWYFSLLGAIACFVMMFRMQAVYASLAVVVMLLLYMGLKHGREGEQRLSDLIRGVLFQMTRRLQIYIQRRQANTILKSWRPAFIAISSGLPTHLASFDILKWISHHQGFGSYFHFVKGSLNQRTMTEANEILSKLVRQGIRSHAGVYVDTIISPEFKTAVSQILQSPGMFGLNNNSILFGFQEGEKRIMELIEGCDLAKLAGFNICILKSSDISFRDKREIHIWMTHDDYRNANFMILLAYLLMGHPEWKGCEIIIFVAFKEKEVSSRLKELNNLIEQGRIPISPKNIQKVFLRDEEESFENLVSKHCAEADLVITGLSMSRLKREKEYFFKKFKNIRHILFVRAEQRIIISEP